jgi:hypothetical protein
VTNRKKKNDTSNLTVKELATKVEDLAPSFVESKVAELAQRILQLENIIKGKDQEIQHLKEMLDSAIPSFEPESKPLTQEELIALKQLELLMHDANNRRLTLEEVKIFDILVKNKRLAQGESTGVVDMVKLPKNKSKLIEIASRPVKDGEDS